jgi:hypothetical protein
MLMAHPDNEPNSEFADRIDSLIDLKEQLTLTDVVEPFYCDVIVGEEGYRCKKQCDMCKEFPK